MGKIISDKLLKQGIDTLPIGRAVFSHRVPLKPAEPSSPSEKVAPGNTPPRKAKQTERQRSTSRSSSARNWSPPVRSG